MGMHYTQQKYMAKFPHLIFKTVLGSSYYCYYDHSYFTMEVLKLLKFKELAQSPM